MCIKLMVPVLLQLIFWHWHGLKHCNYINLILFNKEWLKLSENPPTAS